MNPLTHRTTARPPRLPAQLNEPQLARLLRCPRRDLGAAVTEANIPFIRTADGPRFPLLSVERRLRAIVAEDGMTVLLK